VRGEDPGETRTTVRNGMKPWYRVRGVSNRVENSKAEVDGGSLCEVRGGDLDADEDERYTATKQPKYIVL
jgi:hypothetical protein